LGWVHWFGYFRLKYESTGFCPFLLLYWQEAVLPTDVALGKNPEKYSGVGNSSDRVGTLTTKLSAIREKVKKRMAIVRSKQKKQYDRRHRRVKFVVGHPVLVYHPIRKKKTHDKVSTSLFRPLPYIRSSKRPQLYRGAVVRKKEESRFLSCVSSKAV
jgi:hypothetical protein